MATDIYSTTTRPAFRKSIIYDPETHDFAMALDDELIGFARTYQEAEITLDSLVFAILTHTGILDVTTMPPTPRASGDPIAGARRHVASTDQQPPIELTDFACLMRWNKVYAARCLAHLAAQPRGPELLYRQAAAWASYLSDTHLFPGHDVWLPDDVLANFECAIRVYVASQSAAEEGTTEGGSLDA